MSTFEWMTPQQLQDLRDAGRGHLIDGVGPFLDRADDERKRLKEAAYATKIEQGKGNVIYLPRGGRTP